MMDVSTAANQVLSNRLGQGQVDVGANTSTTNVCM